LSKLPQQSKLASIRARNLRQLLGRAHRQLNALISAELKRRGYDDIRLVHARLLENLDYEGNSISVVAKRAEMTKQAMGSLAMELERKGYVIRSVDKSDGRIWRLRFTRKGWQLMLETFEIVAHVEAELQNQLRPITVESLKRSLDAFAALGAQSSVG
jgi:DNA-binding MarR family transcriptional regulator